MNWTQQRFPPEDPLPTVQRDADLVAARCAMAHRAAAQAAAARRERRLTIAGAHELPDRVGEVRR